jgi:hypothetical protein
VKSAAGAIACVFLLLLAGCGDSEDETTQATATSPAPTTVAEAPPSGPMVRICDRRLAATVSRDLREQGFRGRLGSKPSPSGDRRLSVCELAGRGAEVSISIDAASDAVRRYRNRVTETAQFSGGDPDNAPQTVKGIGDPRLGGAGANWLPRTNLLLSTRDNRVLIVDISAETIPESRLLPAAETVSLDVYDRLG